MGLIKYINKDEKEITYYCSKCNLLIAKIHQPDNYSFTLNLPNKCFGCNEQITQLVTIYEPIIDEVIYD